LYHCKGNVGQLKSDIQFGCANAFLKCISKRKKILQVDITDCANHVRQGIILYKKHAGIVDNLIKKGTKLSFKPNKIETMIKEDNSLPKNFYEDIEKRIQELQERGIDEEEIKFIMSFDIEIKFKKYIRNFESDVNKEEISQIVNKDIITIVEGLLKFAGENLRRVFSAKVFYGLCMHIQSSIERIKQKKPIVNHNIKEIMVEHPNEYAVALRCGEIIKGKYNIQIPVDEVGFIAMFLSVDETADNGSENRPILVVATHGKSTATSMVEVAAKLVGADNLYAYDMPLDKNPQIAYEEIKGLIIKSHHGAGVILLVDMGALTMFGELISEETGIEIQMLDMVSTLLVIECARRSMIRSNVVDICADIKNNKLFFANYTDSIAQTLLPKKDNIIITLCTTGEGSAIKIKTVLEDKLGLAEKNIQIIPMSINDRRQLVAKINKLSKEKKIIAVVGTFNPSLYNIPFVPVSAVFTDERLCGLRAVVERIDNDEVYKQVFFAMKDEMREMDMEDYERMLFEFLVKLQEQLHKNFDIEVVVGLIMHLACAISRMHRNELPPVCVSKEQLQKVYAFEFKCIKESIADLESFYSISFEDDEIGYIFRILMGI
jgi:transcriptional regulatory protein LevR